MCRPRAWEHGDGCVVALTPNRAVFDAARTGKISIDEYEAQFVEEAAGQHLYPGRLSAMTAQGAIVQVRDDDTLLCACSVAKAKARQCHRVWSAELLRLYEWQVRLDGEVLP